MQGYPHGLLAIPSDGYSGQRIVVLVEQQKALIKSTHAEIHHQGRTKMHHVLYPLYYWPGMDATIILKQSAPPALNASGSTDEGRS
jgi:hypothetical protein